MRGGRSRYGTGHISTLHIWWARRPLAACRAVILASLWPDPVDPCGVGEARRRDPRRRRLRHRSAAAVPRRGPGADAPLGTGLRQEGEQRIIPPLVAIQKNPAVLDDPEELRRVLLDFIADFANWDNSTDKDYLDTARALVQAAHEALGGDAHSRPLIIDPFAGGGSIPLEALPGRGRRLRQRPKPDPSPAQQGRTGVHPEVRPAPRRRGP